ncbi:MAG TPA: RimK/LysX family protein [Candidatus Saccharimonadales bacterium]|nr:RimK/LysX family protein [Candidatus Saccharimonadales bacterium]
MPTQKPIIGSNEFVDFPEAGLVRVPAKIDTGADSSAIWASDIREERGVLSFILFGKASPFFTGAVQSTRRYDVATVKNSFGHAECRYKVHLQIRLGGKLIRGRFTLADRANNRFPILIGRRTIQGKFMVDVATKRVRQPGRFLMVSAKISPSVRDFIAAVEREAKGSLSVTHVTYDDIQWFFDSARASARLRTTGEDIASFDMVHFKTSVARDITAALAQYAQCHDVAVVDEAALQVPQSSKLYQYALLTAGGIAVPDSVFVMPAHLAGSYALFAEKLGVPFVFKDINANRSRNNYLITDEPTFRSACAEMLEKGGYAIAQKYIPNDGDYRVLVMGRRVGMVLHRVRTTETHLNTLRSATVRLVEDSELPLIARSASLKAAQIMGRGIAGVDMIQDKISKLWYCLEVNDGPQIATGSFVPEKQRAFADYIGRELKKLGERKL